jgi:hypothetical protein
MMCEAIKPFAPVMRTFDPYGIAFCWNGVIIACYLRICSGPFEGMFELILDNKIWLSIIPEVSTDGLTLKATMSHVAGSKTVFWRAR